MEIHDRKTAWNVWEKILMSLRSYTPIRRQYKEKVKAVLGLLLRRGKIGIGCGPNDRSLLMQAILDAPRGVIDTPDILLDLHEQDPEQYPLDLNLQNDYHVYGTPFIAAVRENPQFAIRLAPHISDATFLRRPFPSWPLMICIIDDIFILSRHHLQSEAIDLAFELLKSRYDFCFPIMGQVSRVHHPLHLAETPLERLQRGKKHADDRVKERLQLLETALIVAIERVTLYSQNFERTVVNALDDRFPPVLFPLILQFAALPTFA